MKSIRLRILLLMFIGAMPSGLSQSWSTEWSNGGNDYIAGWNLRPEDKFLSGEFVYAGWTELFAVHPSGFASLLSGGTSWWSNWGTSNGWIGPGEDGYGWHIGSGDQYLLFKPHNSSLDYIFAANATTHHAMLLYFSSWGGNHFVTSWSNGGLGTIGGWTMGCADRYVSGNFSSAQGSEEVLFVNPNDWAMLQYAPSGESWSSVWSNGGTGGLSGWTISSGDRYQASDVDGDGIDELLCISGGTWSAILKFNGSGWTWVWSNSGGGWIGTWSQGTTESYAAGTVDTESRSEFFAASYTSGHSQVQRYLSTGWVQVWGNGGSGSINGWNISSSDRYLIDDFNTSSTTDRLLLINPSNGWAARMLYNAPAPLAVSISGPSEVYHPGKGSVNTYTWTASVSGGYMPYSNHTWRKDGQIVGTGTSYEESFSYIGEGGGSYQFTLSLTVKDAVLNEASGNKVVTAYIPGGGGGGGDAIAHPDFADASHEALPTGFGMSQNFPNPFNPECTISFSVPSNATVRLVVYDILGREVALLREGRFAGGVYQATWNGRYASGEVAASGVYVYKITAVSEIGQLFSKVMRMTLMK